ncbi:ABC transporter white [Elysia marginata]|uniref:ABC transporter white n=1 Tax=Elysia marginata TaxID=1093978 RepID=A0AAV4G6Z3_9GAST|nr:ABC transporter white [Elysia marginata]
MVGLNDSSDAYFFNLLVVVLVVFNAMSTGTFVSVIAGNYEMSIVVASPVILLHMLFSGFLINTKDIPDYLQWTKEISFMKNGYQLLMVNQWRDFDTIPCPGAEDIPTNMSIQERCAQLACPYSSGDAILAYTSMKDERSEDVLQMSLLGGGFYLMALVGLMIRTRLSRE